jgi:hypothetical protein
MLSSVSALGHRFIPSLFVPIIYWWVSLQYSVSLKLVAVLPFQSLSWLYLPLGSILFTSADEIV